MEKCKQKLNIKCVYFINPKDIKEISEEKGIVMKRKYGKFKREITRIDY
tara:strand:+ start:1065 stop:1211 length:147 start_codon:yes stop_codon:yes gene_type:complete